MPLRQKTIWDPFYRCFTFNQKDLTPTVKEYATLLRISLPNPDKVFWKKGKNECVQRDFVERYIIKKNDDDRVIDIFALVVYGTLVFP